MLNVITFDSMIYCRLLEWLFKLCRNFVLFLFHDISDENYGHSFPIQFLDLVLFSNGREIMTF